MLARTVFTETSSEALMSMGYLVGHSVLEELIKFIVFYLAFRINKPTSIREIVLMGICVGFGFATFESLTFYATNVFHTFLGLIVRTIGHSLFSGVIALLFGMGYFAQMRWIDSGARGTLMSWMVYYQERVLQIGWTFFGLVTAAVLHSLVNIFAALGGQSIAIVFMMVIWTMFIAFLLHPSTGRHYGAIIHEVDLLRQIINAESDLETIEKSGKARSMPDIVKGKKIKKILKQFAKT